MPSPPTPLSPGTAPLSPGCAPGVGARAWVKYATPDELAASFCFVLPPKDPPRLTQGLASPADVETQKASYSRRLEAEAAQCEGVLRARQQQETEMLHKAAADKKRALEEEISWHVSQLGAKYDAQVSNLHGRCAHQKEVLQDQAHAAVCHYQQQQVHENEKRFLHSQQKEEWEEHMRWCEEKAGADVSRYNAPTMVSTPQLALPYEPPPMTSASPVASYVPPFATASPVASYVPPVAVVSNYLVSPIISQRRHMVAMPPSPRLSFRLPATRAMESVVSMAQPARLTVRPTVLLEPVTSNVQPPRFASPLSTTRLSGGFNDKSWSAGSKYQNMSTPPTRYTSLDMSASPLSVTPPGSASPLLSCSANLFPEGSPARSFGSLRSAHALSTRASSFEIPSHRTASPIHSFQLRPLSREALVSSGVVVSNMEPLQARPGDGDRWRPVHQAPSAPSSVSVGESVLASDGRFAEIGVPLNTRGIVLEDLGNDVLIKWQTDAFDGKVVYTPKTWLGKADRTSQAADVERLVSPNRVAQLLSVLQDTLSDKWDVDQYADHTGTGNGAFAAQPLAGTGGTSERSASPYPGFRVGQQAQFLPPTSGYPESMGQGTLSPISESVREQLSTMNSIQSGTLNNSFPSGGIKSSWPSARSGSGGTQRYAGFVYNG